MRRVALTTLLIGGFLLMSARGASSQPMPMEFPELVSGANVIVRGSVVDTHAEWISGSDGTGIVTLISFRVERALKGAVGSQIQLEFLGGTIGDTELTVSHVPIFEVGDRAVLFLDTTELFISPIVGSELGVFPIITSPDGTGDTVVTHDGVIFSSVTDLGVARFGNLASAPSLSLARFESDIVREVEENR